MDEVKDEIDHSFSDGDPDSDRADSYVGISVWQISDERH